MSGLNAAGDPDFTHWDVLAENGKLERMRTIIKSQQQDIAYLKAKVWQLTTQMLNHVHHEAVQAPLVPLNSVGDTFESPQVNEAYF